MNIFFLVVVVSILNQCVCLEFLDISSYFRSTRGKSNKPIATAQTTSSNEGLNSATSTVTEDIVEKKATEQLLEQTTENGDNFKKEVTTSTEDIVAKHEKSEDEESTPSTDIQQVGINEEKIELMETLTDQSENPKEKAIASTESGERSDLSDQSENPKEKAVVSLELEQPEERMEALSNQSENPKEKAVVSLELEQLEERVEAISNQSEIPKEEAVATIKVVEQSEERIEILTNQSEKPKEESADTTEAQQIEVSTISAEPVSKVRKSSKKPDDDKPLEVFDVSAKAESISTERNSNSEEKAKSSLRGTAVEVTEKEVQEMEEKPSTKAGEKRNFLKKNLRGANEEESSLVNPPRNDWFL